MMKDRLQRIQDLSHAHLDMLTRMSETQLLRAEEPAPGYFIAESPRVMVRALQAGYEPVSLLAETGLAERAAELAASMDLSLVPGDSREEQLSWVFGTCPDLPVYTAELAVLNQLTGFPLTLGALCAMRRRVLPSVEEVCQGARRIAVLESVVNPTNVGAIFRSAAALGMDAVLLTAACCDPLYRRAIRVSMGTVFQIPWTWIGRKQRDWPGTAESGEGDGAAEAGGTRRLQVPDARRRPAVQGIPLLHSLGFRTAAMALDDRAVPVDDRQAAGEEKLAIILGTEGEGLDPATIAASDYIVKIPMAHGVDSLNVAAASAVAFWALRGT